MEPFVTVQLFDQLVKDTKDVFDVIPRLIKAYIETLQGYEEVRVNWQKALDECKHLQNEGTETQKEISSLRGQMQTVRRLIDEEKQKRKQAEHERDLFEVQLDQLREILKDNRNRFPEDTKRKLLMMNNPYSDVDADRQNTPPNDFETTGSVMSDLSYTRDEDDFVDISLSDTKGTKRAAGNGAIPRRNRARKKRRSSSAVRYSELERSGGADKQQLVATTTVTVDHKSNIHASSQIETTGTGSPNKQNINLYIPVSHTLASVDENDELDSPRKCIPHKPFSMNSLNTRPHNFQQKAMLKSEMCNVCSKRIKFSSLGLKCKDCKTTCHVTCSQKAPLPCVALGGTPGKSNRGTISDYAPIVPPKVPSLVVHCINEIEARGMSEVGIYRIPGSDKEVKSLKEKFLRGKGTPNLSQILDIHIICGCLKEFLRSLKDPLTTQYRWEELGRSAEMSDIGEKRQKLFQIVTELPQANRDTLAYLMLHLQRVAEVPDCKMPISNLSKVFGPTVIGYSCNEPENVYGETRMSNKIMEELLSLPGEYWESFVRECNLVKTPSSTSITNFSPFSRIKCRKNMRYFETP